MDATPASAGDDADDRARPAAPTPEKEAKSGVLGYYNMPMDISPIVTEADDEPTNIGMLGVNGRHPAMLDKRTAHLEKRTASLDRRAANLEKDVVELMQRMTDLGAELMQRMNDFSAGLKRSTEDLRQRLDVLEAEVRELREMREVRAQKRRTERGPVVVQAARANTIVPHAAPACGTVLWPEGASDQRGRIVASRSLFVRLTGVPVPVHAAMIRALDGRTVVEQRDMLVAPFDVGDSVVCDAARKQFGTAFNVVEDVSVHVSATPDGRQAGPPEYRPLYEYRLGPNGAPAAPPPAAPDVRHPLPDDLAEPPAELPVDYRPPRHAP